MSVKYVLIPMLLSPLICILSVAQVSIKGGHSHNDYLRVKPLTEALFYGLVSVEADVLPIGDELWVAHSLKELDSERTLEKLYLQPLDSLARNNQLGNIILLVDIKEEAEKSYKLLKEQLKRYSSFLTVFQSDTIIYNKVTVIISGARPISLLSEDERFAALDGRLDEISFNYGNTFYPLISEDWNKFFTWKGNGVIEEKELALLKEFVNKCHKQNRIIRFWGFSANQATAVKFWRLFEETGVDLIGVDDPASFKLFKNQNQ